MQAQRSDNTNTTYPTLKIWLKEEFYSMMIDNRESRACLGLNSFPPSRVVCPNHLGLSPTAGAAKALLKP